MPPAAVLLIAYVGTAPALKNRYPNVVTVTTGTLPPQECAVAVNPSTNQPLQQQPSFINALPALLLSCIFAIHQH